MKLGISYNMFDGEELLEGSIRYIRNQVDYISAVYQTNSWFGPKASPALMETLNRLVEKKYIDELYEYRSEVDKDDNEGVAHLQQLEKRNIGLELSRKNGCTHHMPIDADEFYIPEQFKAMKDFMDTEKADTCALQHRQYYKDSIYMITPSEQEYIIGIFKIYDDTEFVYKIPCPVPVDPSRKPNNKRFAVFGRDMVEMHHMSYVRKNIYGKLISSIQKDAIRHNIEKITDYYNNWQYPAPAMWAGGNLLQVIKIDRKFDVYSELEEELK